MHTLRLALACLILVGCASTDIGKAIQTGEGAKLAVEAAADEVIRIHVRQTQCVTAAGQDAAKLAACAALPSIGEAPYAQAKAAYEKWAAAQTAYTEAIVAWSRSKTAAADARVQAALTNLGPTMNAAADALCAFRKESPTLASACVQLGR